MAYTLRFFLFKIHFIS